MIIMADRLINLIYEINSIQSEKNYLKKFFIYKKIKIFKKELYDSLKKESYLAADIVNFSLLVDAAKTLKLCKDTKDYSIQCIKGAKKSRWPVISVIHANLYGMRFIFNSHMDSEIDLDGTVHITLSINNTMPSLHFYNEQYRKEDITYSRDVKIIQKIENINQIGESASFIQMINASYVILPNIFSIFIEMIIQGLKEKYIYGNKDRIKLIRK